MNVTNYNAFLSSLIFTQLIPHSFVIIYLFLVWLHNTVPVHVYTRSVNLMRTQKMAKKKKASCIDVRRNCEAFSFVCLLFVFFWFFLSLFCHFHCNLWAPESWHHRRSARRRQMKRFLVGVQAKRDCI